jgi:hypothetical protein
MTVDADTTWFYKNSEQFLRSKDFIDFQNEADVDFHDLLRDEPLETRRTAQRKLVEQCVILNEIQKQHFGYAFPLFVYTHWLGLCDDYTLEKVPKHNVELDKKILAFPMCDSLRRRHIALSRNIIPNAITEVYQERKEPVVVKNLGSGVGLDTMRAAVTQKNEVSTVLNYDIAAPAIDLGETIARYLEEKNELKKGVVKFLKKKFSESIEPADLIVYVGVICGLNDEFAIQYVLKSGYEQLRSGGKAVICSSNCNMKDADPLASFLIQHIGSREDPAKPWSLNFRTRETMEKVVRATGFREVEIYDDSNYPRIEDLEPSVLYGVERLPAQSKGFSEHYEPLRLPAKEKLDERIGYNWIAVATK